MIDRIQRILNLIPNNDRFGKLPGLLAILYTKVFINSFGEKEQLTRDDIIWLNSVLFYNRGGVVEYRILNPTDLYEGVRIRVLGKLDDRPTVKDIYLDRNYPIDYNQLAAICTSLGFSDAINFMSMNYGISSNIMLTTA